MPAAVKVTINSKDRARLEANFRHFRRETTPERLRNFAEDEGYPVLQHRAALRFGREGDDAAGMWNQLSPVTGRLRVWQAAKEGLPIGAQHPINVRRDTFRRWVLGTHDITARGTKDTARATLTIPSSRTSKNNWRKLKSAQLGGTTHLPQGGAVEFEARPVVAVSKVDQRLMERKAQLWVRRILGGMK